MVLEKTLERPLTARRLSQSILKKISPEFLNDTDADSETPGHPIVRTDSLEKTLMLGKIKGRRKGG